MNVSEFNVAVLFHNTRDQIARIVNVRFAYPSDRGSLSQLAFVLVPLEHLQLFARFLWVEGRIS